MCSIRGGVLEEILDFEVLGLEGQALGFKASSPQKLPCPRLEDSTTF